MPRLWFKICDHNAGANKKARTRDNKMTEGVLFSNFSFSDVIYLTIIARIPELLPPNIVAKTTASIFSPNQK
jgi:hypothetical protein